MKTKYFMRGLGTGLIVATLILCIIYAYKMSDSQIISRAKELGMVYEKEENSPIVLEGDEAENSEKDTNDSDENTGVSKEENTESQKPEGESSAQPQENTTSANGEQQSTEVQNAGQEHTDTPYVNVTINGGMNSVEVSKILKNLGVISDADSFDYYLVKNGYSKNLQPGEHKLLKGANYEELAYILTHRQN